MSFEYKATRCDLEGQIGPPTTEARRAAERTTFLNMKAEEGWRLIAVDNGWFYWEREGADGYVDM